MATPYKIDCKIGIHEFSAEGEENSVRADYQRFIDAINATTPRPLFTSLQDEGIGARIAALMRLPAQDDGLQDKLDYLRENGISYNEARELFAITGVDPIRIRLKEMPRVYSLADGLILLILGYEKLVEGTPVEASALSESAQDSGFTFDRLDRAIAPRKEFLEIDGKTSGTRYDLNIHGRAYSTMLARKILEEKNSPDC